MWLTAPIYVLKRQAKLLARQNDITLHLALDKVATKEGYQTWSHLASATKNQSPALRILPQLDAGDTLLIGARPGQGKTLLGLELALNAPRIGRKGYFFTLDYHAQNVAERLQEMTGADAPDQEELFVDTSDDIFSGYIINRLKAETEPTLFVVDYLQLLDQKRTHPSLQHQMDAMLNFVTTTGAVCVMISQIDRAFDLMDKAIPDAMDIRLPNPLDLSVFNRTCYLNNGRVYFQKEAPPVG